MTGLAAAATEKARVYLTGGATAVLHGWRDSTIDIDMKAVPELDSIFRAIPRLKETLHINVETAAPDQFLPPLPDWEERSESIEAVGMLSFFHYDYYAQALSKIERSHARDLLDVEEMLRRGLVHPRLLLEFFKSIEPQLYRYPAIDPPTLRRAIETIANR